MVARSNLNRIKGILSAKQGAGIPKLEQGAQMTQSTGGAKFKKQKAGTIIYSNDGANWFTDENLQQPHVGGIDGFIDVTTDIATPALAIPGDLNVTPTTAVEKAADLATKTEAHKDENIASYIAASVILPEAEIVATKPKSPNEGVDLKAENTSVGMHVDTDVDGSEDDDSGRDDTGSNNNSAKFGKYAQASSQILKGVGDVFGAQQATTDSNLTKTTDQIYNVAADAIKQAGPVGQYVGTAMQFAGAAGNIIQALGGGTDQMTKTDQWMDSSLFSWNIGMLNGFGGKRANSFAADETTIRNVGGSYGGTVADIEDAQAKAGKKYGLFSSGSRKRANRAIAAAQAKQNIMADISEDAMDRRSIVQSMGEQAGLAYSLMTNGGYNQKYTYAAKHGGLLEWNPVITLEWEPQVELNWKLPEFKEGGNIEFNTELEWIPELQKGGELGNNDVPEIEETNQKNVIPEGALHKNKHHMEHAEGLTKKGIPVIDEDGEQQAEIEHSEIIFTLEVTKKLEEYYDIFYSEESSNKEKEQAALDAGKLLVYQILENTEDRTGLIESCKKGGSITLKKSTDDLIEEALDWMPTLMIVEEVIEEVKQEEKPKKKSEKDQMKEAIKEVLIELLIK